MLAGQLGILPGEEFTSDPIIEQTFATRGPTYVWEDGTNVVLGNDHIELNFTKFSGCGLDKIIDKSSGLDLRSNKLPPAMLYILFYHTGSALDAAIQWDATAQHTELINGSGFSRVYLNHTEIKGYNINTSVCVTLYDDASMAEMTLDVFNDETFILKYLLFPLVWGLGPIGADSTDDSVFYPGGDGLIIHDPLSDITNLNLGDIYPSSCSMQVMCHYDPDEVGLYMATYDTNGHPKMLTLGAMNWAAQDHLAAIYQHYVEESPGNDFNMDHNAVIGSFHGDWYEAARIYKEWAETTPFVSGGKVYETKTTPDWFANTSIISSSNRDGSIVHNSLSKINSMTTHTSNVTGLNTTALIFAWAKEGGWVGPNYFPPAAGEANFKNTMSSFNDTGDHGMLYISGTVWRISRSDIGYSDWEFFNSTGKEWAAINETGGVHIDPGYLTIGWECARMDPMTDFWHDYVVNNTLECLDLGVDVVQIDEFPIGSIYPTYNASHGNPIGYSNDQALAYQSILNDCQVQGRAANPNLILSAEHCNEFYVPYLDTYVSRDNAPEFLIYPFAKDYWVDQIEFVPFFQHVYHEYITTFGEPLPMETSYPEAFNPQVKRAIANCLVTGEIVTAGGAVEGEWWPELQSMYNRTARAQATYCNDYVIKGEMLEPPSINVPLKQVMWYFGSLGRFGKPFNESVVYNSAWRSDAGDIGHVFVNWNDSAESFDVELPAYDLVGNYSLYITRNGEKQLLERSIQLPNALNLNMQADDVILLEITQVPDLAVDDLSGWNVLTNETIPINFTVWNTGTGPSAGFDVTFYQDGAEIGTDSVSSLAAGATDIAQVMWDTTELLGDFDITAVADNGTIIFELDEMNNSAMVQMTVWDRPRSDLVITVKDNVTDEPIGSADIELMRTDLVAGPWTGQTNATGQVIFSSLIAGAYEATGSIDDYYDSTGAITFGEDVVAELTLRLDPIPVLVTLSGNITENGTGALADVQVNLSWASNSTFISTAMTDASGHFSFASLSVANYTLNLSKSGYYSYEEDVELTGLVTLVDLDLKLVPIPPPPPPPPPGKGTIRGAIKDATTDAWIADATLTLIGTNSTFVTDLTGGYLFPNVEEGNYTVNVTADGYYPQEGNVTVVPDTDVWLNFSLVVIKGPEPAGPGWFFGTVVDENGTGIPGARIADESNNTLGLTSSDGSFNISLGAGAYDVTITKDGFEPEDLQVTISADTGTEREIVLEEIPVVDPPPVDGQDGDGGSSSILYGVLFVVLLVVVILLLAIGAAAFLLMGRSKSSEEPTEDEPETPEDTEPEVEGDAGPEELPDEEPEEASEEMEEKLDQEESDEEFFDEELEDEDDLFDEGPDDLLDDDPDDDLDDLMDLDEEDEL